MNLSEMSQKLGEKFRRFKEWLREGYKKLEKYYAATGFQFSFQTFILVIVLFAVLVALLLFFLRFKLLVSLISFFAILSLVLSVPITIRNTRISQIESDLPDVLKHMAMVLKAGGTTEAAVEEVSNAGYGPLSVDLKSCLKQLREGRSFEDVLKEVAENSGSTLFQRCITIIVDAKKAGAGLADIMLSLSDDMKDLTRVKRERYSRTTMHVIFLILASFLLSPFIFGFVTSIVCYIGSGITAVAPTEVVDLSGLSLLLTAFLALQATVSIITIGIIRVGKGFKYALYIPLIVLLAVMVFEAGKFISTLVVGVSAVACIY
jgi:pilus assembly protein TadC